MICNKKEEEGGGTGKRAAGRGQTLTGADERREEGLRQGDKPFTCL